MELDNQYIKQQIDSVTEFPDGYTPNLETKWEILATSIQEQKKQKATLLLWGKISAAASVLIIMGLCLRLFTQQGPIESKIASQLNTDSKIQQILPSPVKVEKEIKPINKVRKRTAVIPIEEIVNDQVAFTYQTIDTNQVKAVNPAIVLPIKATAKMDRNVEIDFFEPAISVHTSSETIVKAIQFKFTLKLAEYPKNLNVNNYQTHGIKTTFE